MVAAAQIAAVAVADTALAAVAGTGAVAAGMAAGTAAVAAEKAVAAAVRNICLLSCSVFSFVVDDDSVRDRAGSA